MFAFIHCFFFTFYSIKFQTAGLDTVLDSVRVARGINSPNNNQNNKINNDQEFQETENKNKVSAAESSSIDELTLDSLEDDENRGKRFVFIIEKEVHSFLRKPE